MNSPLPYVLPNLDDLPEPEEGDLVQVTMILGPDRVWLCYADGVQSMLDKHGPDAGVTIVACLKHVARVTATLADSGPATRH